MQVKEMKTPCVQYTHWLACLLVHRQKGGYILPVHHIDWLCIYTYYNIILCSKLMSTHHDVGTGTWEHSMKWITQSWHVKLE